MEIKAQIMDGSAMLRSLRRMTHEIIERNRGVKDIMLIGVRRRGVTLAKALAENIERFEGVRVPVGFVDISLYRDDLSEISELPRSAENSFPADVRDKTVILTDDVIFTGRTVRAAIEAVFAVGRPKAIQLAVLIDRGHRELPLKPDYVGKNVPTSHSETVFVEVEEYDGQNRVLLGEK